MQPLVGTALEQRREPGLLLELLSCVVIPATERFRYNAPFLEEGLLLCVMAVAARAGHVDLALKAWDLMEYCLLPIQPVSSSPTTAAAPGINIFFLSLNSGPSLLLFLPYRSGIIVASLHVAQCWVGRVESASWEGGISQPVLKSMTLNRMPFCLDFRYAPELHCLSLPPTQCGTCADSWHANFTFKHLLSRLDWLQMQSMRRATRKPAGTKGIERHSRIRAMRCRADMHQQGKMWRMKRRICWTQKRCCPAMCPALWPTSPS